MRYLTTPDDRDYASERSDRAEAEARDRNDHKRDLSPLDYAGEIDMLRRALDGDLTGYTPAGVATMRGRLDWLRGLTVPMFTEARSVVREANKEADRLLGRRGSR